MNKFTIVSLLSSVLLLNACGQQNIKVDNNQVNPATEKLEKQKTAETQAIDKMQDTTVELITSETQISQEQPQNQPGSIKKPEVKPSLTKNKVVIDSKNITDTSKVINLIIEKKKVKSLNITGRISLNTDAIKNKEVEIKSTVVYFQPTGYKGMTLKKENHVIASQNKRFVPNVLAIQKGSTVTFPNMDRILHNVFSVSTNQKFDLGLYSSGKEKTVKFENAGIIYVHCNVHHSMQADILVLDTPFYTSTDDKGNFSLENIPNTPGELFIWHPRAKLQKIMINDLGNLTKLNQTINIVRKKIPKHLNKFGSPYRPKRKK